jgi:acyl-CoA thioesterase-2
MSGSTDPDLDSRSAALARLLTVSPLDTDLFRGARQPGGRGRVFGGQVIAQGLMSAAETVDPGRAPHALHACFLRGGDEDHPIDYRVERDFDGGSFSNRRVVAIQKDRPILTLSCSFHITEDGLSHQDAMPDVPAPETLPSEAGRIEALGDQVPEMWRHFIATRPVEMRPVEDWTPIRPAPREPRRRIWFRLGAGLGDDPRLHRAALAYVSDMALLSTAIQPHGVSWLTPGFQSASLDHALWLHADARMDDWLLYDTDSPWAGGARGFNRGRLFTREGKLIASTAQEGLIRLRD